MGELVITTLTKKAMPLVRYRTGDITMLLASLMCQGGGTHPKTAPIRGRVNHMVKVQGKIVFPNDVEDFISGNLQLGSDYQMVADRLGDLDVLRLKVEYQPGISNLK